MAAAPYQQQVPAVARAIEALRHLAESAQPASLARLSRAMGVSPSSLLAILNTLRAAGLVTRLEPEGTWMLGPGLAALGTEAGDRLAALPAFERAALHLAAQTSETVLLWMRHGDEFVLTAAHEGAESLRYVRALGARISAAVLRPAHAIEVEIEPGVLLLGTTLPTTGRGETAVVGVAGPVERLSGAAGDRVRAALAAVREPSPPRQDRAAGGSQAPAWELAGPIATGDVDEFLGQGLVATLSYLSDDGYPATVPLWYDWDGAAFWLVPRPGAEWAEHVRRNPRVSLAVSESEPPLRRVLARGAVDAIVDPGGARWRHLRERLLRRYAGLDAARYLENHQAPLLRLTPKRLIAWRGLLHLPSAASVHGEERGRSAV